MCWPAEMSRRDSGVKSEPTTPKSDDFVQGLQPSDRSTQLTIFLSTRNLVEPNLMEIRNHIDKQHAYLYSVAVQRFRYAENKHAAVAELCNFIGLNVESELILN